MANALALFQLVTVLFWWYWMPPLWSWSMYLSIPMSLKCEGPRWVCGLRQKEKMKDSAFTYPPFLLSELPLYHILDSHVYWKQESNVSAWLTADRGGGSSVREILRPEEKSRLRGQNKGGLGNGTQLTLVCSLLHSSVYLIGTKAKTRLLMSCSLAWCCERHSSLTLGSCFIFPSQGKFYLGLVLDLFI